MAVPALLAAFNRPALTHGAIEHLRRAPISALYVSVDGPRDGHPSDVSNCQQVREIVERADLDVPVTAVFGDRNLGCARGVAAAIGWFFDHVDEGIVLEPDCRPNEDFFCFTADLLTRYRDDERVMMISGNQFAPPGGLGADRYRFMRVSQVWGWATWKRAWDRFDLDMSDWPACRDRGWLLEVCRGNTTAAAYWTRQLDRTYHGEIDSWAYRWYLSYWRHGGLAAAPPFNLVDNLGFDADATHVPTAPRWYLRAPRGSMRFPLVHPDRVEPDLEAEAWLDDHVYRSGAPWANTPRRTIRRIVDAAHLGGPYDRLRRWIP